MKKLIFTLGFLAAVNTFAQSEIKTTITGDIRIRNESLEVEGGTGKDNYDQLRMRARLAAKSQINETLSTEIRVATGTGGTTTNQNFSGTRNYAFNLDRAFAKYMPNDKTVVRIGRTENPYILVGDNSMLFDADLNFDGASAAYTWKGDSLSTQLLLAHSIIFESSSAVPNADAKLESAELAFRFGSDNNSFLVTVADHLFTGLKGNPSFLTPATLQGNTGGATYKYNYDVTAIGFEYSYKGGTTPITLFAEMANNNATSKEDTASIFGIKFNKLKKKGDWMLSVDSREVQSDSTLAAMTDSDSFGGGTDGRSLNATLAYSLEDNANVMVTYMNGKLGIASGETAVDRNRVQADLNIKF